MWCLLPEIPHEAISQLTDDLLTAEARVDPIYARANWGLLQEQRQRAGRLETDDGDGQTPGEIDPRLAGGGAPRRG